MRDSQKSWPQNGRPQLRVATVLGKELLTPKMVRVHLDGAIAGFDRLVDSSRAGTSRADTSATDSARLCGFTPIEATEAYLKCLFVPPGAPYTVPTEENLQGCPPEFRPKSRRLTVRAWNREHHILSLDVVTHGDSGYAGRWAKRVKPGEVLYFQGPSGKYRPDPAADWYLYAGDETALPAISASLEVLESGSRAVVMVVIDSPGHEIEPESQANVEMYWLYRNQSSRPEFLLSEAVAALEWRPGRVDVFVHGEAAEVRATRRVLIADRGVDRATASISPYWRRNHDDEAWRAVKRQWLAEQDDDF